MSEGDIEVEIMRLPHGADLPLPAYQSAQAAGLDLMAAVPADAPLVLAPGGRALIPTGVAIALPDGYAGFVQPRSGLALRHGVTCLNSPGLIDSGYRDELRVVLVNTDPEHAFEVHRGDRIAQLVVQRVEACELTVVDALPESVRGFGGFGSTGT